MRSCLISQTLFVLFALAALAQECPKWDPAGPDVPSAARVLQGKLIYHDDLRQWFELKLDHPECGQDSVQLVRVQGSVKPLEVLRGCRVRSTGVLGDAGTGYYSLDIYQEVSRIAPDRACTRKLPFPNYSHLRPAPDLRRYRVEMDVNYRSGDHPAVFRITSGSRVLHPWQTYASYWLTGSFVLYGHCGHGFVVDKVFGTKDAVLGHFDEPRTSNDQAAFDPEGAAAAGVHDLKLGYTCIRAN